VEAADTAGAAGTATSIKRRAECVETVPDEDVRPDLRANDERLVGVDSDHEPEPPWRWPRAVYVHIPFCAHKCGYCDFASLAGVDHLADRYLATLEREVETCLQGPQQVDTIFVGGGTPTRLRASQLETLCGFLKKWFVLPGDGEWTVEANPGTIDAEKADVLAEAGVNRISLGAQSFQPDLLAVLERQHGRAEVVRALEVIRPRFARWSLDLIFGVPGSTPSQWRDDLETALSLRPSHLSCYGLVFEKGTPLWARKQNGQVQPLGEEIERLMYETTIERLAQAGLAMYEISNFARPGEESRHNLVYWANDAYFGFGVGAARYLRGVRSTNTRDLDAYLRRVEAGESATGPHEELSPEERARETAMLMLRRTRAGIERGDFKRRTGFDLDLLCGSAIERFLARGYLEDDGRTVRLTRQGVFVADHVFCELL
jgi:putative oxygen-independent coproporphyrinogen III oxidase